MPSDMSFIAYIDKVLLPRQVQVGNLPQKRSPVNLKSENNPFKIDRSLWFCCEKPLITYNIILVLQQLFLGALSDQA